MVEMKFSLIVLLVVTVTSCKGMTIKSGLDEIKSQIEHEREEISEKLSDTIKNVTNVSTQNVNNDPIVTPAIKELNSYLETMKTSADEGGYIRITFSANLKQAPDTSSEDSTSNSTNCTDPLVIQSIQNVGQAQQLVSSILTNVSNTISTVASNFDALSNSNVTGDPNSVAGGIFNALTSILQTFLAFTNDQITSVNDRIEENYNTFSQAAFNSTICKPENSSVEEVQPVATATTANENTSTDTPSTTLSTEQSTVSTTSSTTEGISNDIDS